MVNLCFLFCSAAESIGQDGAILPDDQQVKLRLHVQFFTRDGNAISRNYCIAVARTNCCV